MPCHGSAEHKAAMLAKYRTDPDKWFQRPEELSHVSFRAYFEDYTISARRPTSQRIVVYTDAKDFSVYLRQKRKKHLVSVCYATTRSVHRAASSAYACMLRMLEFDRCEESGSMIVHACIQSWVCRSRCPS